jgi:UDP-glucose 4-epimerase
MLAASAPDAAGHIINVCTGVATSVSDVVGKLFTLLGTQPSKAKFGAIGARPSDVAASSGCGEKAAALLNWRPEVALDEGLRLSIEWIISRTRGVEGSKEQ